MTTLSIINVPKPAADDEVTKLSDLLKNTLTCFKYDEPCREIRVLRKNNKSLDQTKVLFKENGRTKTKEVLLEMPKSIASTKTGKLAFSNFIVALMKSNNPFNKENTLVSISIKAGEYPGRFGTRFRLVEDITTLDIIQCVEPSDHRLNKKAPRATVTFMYYDLRTFS